MTVSWISEVRRLSRLAEPGQWVVFGALLPEAIRWYIDFERIFNIPD